jgi:hypothetical protein
MVNQEAGDGRSMCRKRKEEKCTQNFYRKDEEYKTVEEF